ncbi:hypothetical protein EUTSA_v10009268mg [Eutrema salsugineum]|uniref:Uncharacterized protein n=1 Tax=Eutrema salsugineum TaxID=72664 RepID=V4KE37_EUTSA|nr:hypothetical protein EUTSA_v10009268mg [Eutrema salsugineum]
MCVVYTYTIQVKQTSIISRNGNRSETRNPKSSPKKICIASLLLLFTCILYHPAPIYQTFLICLTDDHKNFL